MKTSYFAKSSKDPNAVSIARSCPAGFKGRVYKKLAPPYSLLKKYKEDLDEDFYTKEYNEILAKLNPETVYEELGPDVVLLCWELSGKFCHRRLVAKWLSDNLGLDIQEI